ncbi:hypothetical protein CBS101457_001532 [Exobasidium rhododendri]|nr:hypothetical protein CBS101457_001532 [Exobasidium rhododendri]
MIAKKEDPSPRPQIAIEGCSHGSLDQIYSSILSLDRKVGKRTSLLLLCGDVQTLRNASDMHCLAVPQKHKRMGDFHRYYSGERSAPILTLMIGGNHEASNYLWELYHGGWVAPNIYYLGAAGCVDVGGLTIAGISGIYKSHDYTLGRFEQLPYTPGTIRSAYHTRKFDTFRLHTVSRKPDIVLSHDWPNTIEQRGDVNWLKKRKPFFVDEINTSSLGSPPLWKLLQDLRPKYWFSAHLHVRFAALVKHSGEPTQVRGQNHSRTSTSNNPEQIVMSDEDFDEEPAGSSLHDHSSLLTASQEAKNLEDAVEQGTTRFLALSKCLEGQDFLQILDVPAPFDSEDTYSRRVGPEVEGHDPQASQPSFQFNRTWLAVVKATHAYLSLEKKQKELPKELPLLPQVEEEVKWIKDRFSSMNNGESLDVEAVQRFVKTAPATNDVNGQMSGPPPWYTNPQTEALCSLLGIENRINPPPRQAPLLATSGAFTGQAATPRPLPFLSEAEEIRRIEEAAQNAMNKQVHESEDVQEGAEEEEGEEAEPVTLLDQDEGAARWKEGTG